jgi:hypothetical protein
VRERFNVVLLVSRNAVSDTADVVEAESSQGDSQIRLTRSRLD